MIKVAVIGAGYWGKNLVRNFYELGALQTICDASEKNLHDLQQKFPGVKTTSSPQEVFADPSIQAVVIAAPASLHYELAKQALEAGKDVFVEKPLALEVSHAKELSQLAQQTRRVLMVGHILNYHPAYQKLRELVLQGALGNVQHVSSNRMSWGKILTEENVLWSFAPHDVSMVLNLLNEKPESVAAHGSAFLQEKIVDIVHADLRFANGKTAHITASWAHPFKEHRLIVIGSKKIAVFDDTKPWAEKLALYAHTIDWTSGPNAVKGETEYAPLEEGEPLKAECQQFLQCVQTCTPALTDAGEGLRCLEVLNALQRSLEKQGSPMSFTSHSNDYYVHETAIVEKGATIGKGTKVWHFSHVLPDSTIGEKCSLGQNVVMMQRSSLGNNVKVQNNVSIYEGVHVEDDAFLGPSMVFTNVVNPRSHVSRKDEYRDTFVRKGASIGANATVVCGHEIGQYAFVGAGAVVTKNIPAFALVYGNPAKQYGWMCQCGVKLPFAVDGKAEEGACTTCKTRYKRDALTLTMLG